MASLYELTQDAAYLQELLENGDIDEQVFSDSMEALMIKDKLESVCKVMRNLEAQVAAFKEEEDRLAKKRKTAENGVKRLKDRLLNFMQVSMDKKVKAGLFTISLGTATSVDVVDADKLPECYWKPQPPTIDKTGIGAALRDGKEVPGAVFKKSNYVTIK